MCINSHEQYYELVGINKRKARAAQISVECLIKMYVLMVKREYHHRLDALSFYSERKFIQRYRLSKEVVRILVDNYVDSLPSKELRGIHTIPHRIMVCISL